MSDLEQVLSNQKLFVPLDWDGEIMLSLAVVLHGKVQMERAHFAFLIQEQLIQMSEDLEVFQLVRVIQDTFNRDNFDHGLHETNLDVWDDAFMQDEIMGLLNEVDWKNPANQKATTEVIQKEAREYLNEQMHLMEFLSQVKNGHDLL